MIAFLSIDTILIIWILGVNDVCTYTVLYHNELGKHDQ